MTLDLAELQGALLKLEQDMGRVREDIAQIRRFANAAAKSDLLPEADLRALGLTLPREILVRRTDVVAGYLAAHPDLTELVGEVAAALVEEFRGERSEIEPPLYQDPEIEDQYLAYYVRVPRYDDSLLPRIRAVSEKVDNRFPLGPNWVHVTTDSRPMR